MKRASFLIFTICLLAVIFFTKFFIIKTNFPLNRFFSTQKGLYDENLSLKKQNQELKAQIFKFHQATDYQLIASSTSVWLKQYQYKTAKVLSSYPFNTKNALIINLGMVNNVQKMMPVAISENVLIGEIEEVFNEYSVVKTIFDPSFQLPIRIGENEINGFLTGGDKIKISLVEKKEEIKIGDVVYSASKDFPYGFKIGEINEINDSTNGNFKEAFVSPSFNLNELRDVYLILNNGK